MPGRREDTPVGWIVAVVFAALVGFVIGRASESSPPAEAPKQASPGPHGSRSGVPTGFAHTEAGAVAALLSHAAALGHPRVVVDARRRAQVLSVVATPRYAATFAGQSAVGLEAVRRSSLGRGLATGAQTIYLASPIAYRVVSFTRDQAVVEGWGVSVIGNSEGLEPRATWGKTLATARWQNGDWRIDDVEAREGPTPKLAPGQVTSSPDDFLARLDGLRGVRHGP